MGTGIEPSAPAATPRIASIGMAEHVGRARMPEYFDAARAALRPGGLFLNHAVTRQPECDSAGTLIGGPVGRLLGQQRSFIDAYVFPDGELLPLTDMLAPAQAAGFEVVDVQSLRLPAAADR